MIGAVDMAFPRLNLKFLAPLILLLTCRVDCRKELTARNGLNALLTLFIGFQALEYKYSAIHRNDSAYGSIFYMVTFHGFHVFVGSIFILTCFCRVFNAESVTTRQQNFGYCSRN